MPNETGEMKDKLVAHLVSATTLHGRRVVLCAAVMCALSVATSVLFLDFDLTFKGMIGSGVPVVDNYDRIIRDFKVSGVITVAVEPSAEMLAADAELKKRIDDLVLSGITDEGRGRVVNLVKEYGGGGFQTLSDRSTIRVMLAILGLLDEGVRDELLMGIEGTTEEERDLVRRVAAAPEEAGRDQRIALRKLQNLPRADGALLIASVDGLSAEDRTKIVHAILPHLSVFDKRTLLEEGGATDQETLQAALANLDELALKLESMQGEFKTHAQELAVELRAELAQGGKSAKGEPLDEIVKAVLYSDEFSVSADQLMFLIMISPQKNIDEMRNAKQFTRVVDDALEQLKSRNPELSIRRTGFAAVQMDAQDAMFTDFGIMMALTAMGILLVFLLGLKSVVFPLLSMIPLVVGVLVMFGIYAFVGTLNLFSMMTPIILFGLGIDYAIHFGSRYGEVRMELGSKVSQAQVLTRTFESIGSGLVIASLTTIFAFLSLTMSNINGFAESGILAASGVVSAFISMMYLLPVLVTWRESRFKRTGANFLKSRKFLGMGRAAAGPVGAAISVAMCALALSAFVYLPRIGVERDGMKLTPQVESVTLSKDLEEKFNFTDVQSYIVLKGYKNLKKFRREMAKTNDDGSPRYGSINASRIMDARKAIRTFEKLG